jgi:hypothetical protein
MQLDDEEDAAAAAAAASTQPKKKEQRWYADFCIHISPDTLTTIAVYGAALHPLYLDIESNACYLMLLQRSLRPHVVPIPYIRAAIILLREGMRHTLDARLIPPLAVSDEGMHAFMRSYHSFAALRFQRRLRDHPELLSATVRVLVQGPFFTARMETKPIESCRRIPFFTGHTIYDLLMRADLRVLPSVFNERHPVFMAALHDARYTRDSGNKNDYDYALPHRIRLKMHAPMHLREDIDATVQHNLLFLNRSIMMMETQEDDGCDFYEPYGLILRTELANSLAVLRHDIIIKQE